MRALGRSLWSWLVLAVSAAVAGGEQPARVGELGRPERLIIQGATAFTADEVKSGLFGDLDLLLAAHPLGSRLGYLWALGDRTIAGYQHAGFADVDVRVRLVAASDEVVVEVREGPRYSAGSIHVTGTHSVPDEPLIERLTKPYPPADAVPSSFRASEGKTITQWIDREGKIVDLEDPEWTPGDPAALAPEDLARLRKQVKCAFADLGCFFPEFTIDVAREPKTGTADLVIHVADEGPKATAKDVEIEGNRANSREEILAYLGLEPDTALTRQACLRMEQRLWDSARFADYRVVPVRAAQAGAACKLRIELSEYEKAPRLSEEFSAEEKLLLKCRDWLVGGGARERDTVFHARWPDGSFKLVVSRDQGVLILFGEPSEDDDASELRHAVVFSSDSIACYSATTRRKLIVPTARREWVGSVSFGVEPVPDEEGKRFKTKFHLHFKPAAEGESRRAFRFGARLPPVFFVAQVDEDDAECSLSDGVFTVRSAAARIEIDAETGELLRYAPALGDEAQNHVWFRCRQGAFQRRRNQIDESAADWPDAFEPHRPAGSMVGYLLDDFPVWDLLRQWREKEGETNEAPSPAEIACFRKLLDRGVLDPLDQWIAAGESGASPAADRFVVPVNPGSSGGGEQGWRMRIAEAALYWADTLFRPDTWPCQLWREWAFVLADRYDYTEAVLDRLYTSPENGPICFLATAGLLKPVNRPGAHRFATRGIERLSLSDFRRDYRVLTDSQTLAGKCIEHIGEVLRGLKPQEVELLGRMLFEEDGGFLTEAARILREQRDRPVADVLPAALDRAWEAGLSGRVEAALRALLMLSPLPQDEPRPQRRFTPATG